MKAIGSTENPTVKAYTPNLMALFTKAHGPKTSLTASEWRFKPTAKDTKDNTSMETNTDRVSNIEATAVSTKESLKTMSSKVKEPSSGPTSEYLKVTSCKA